MKTVVGDRWSVLRVLLSALGTAFLVGCSIPTLEEAECREARDTVREFYSWYFAADAQQRTNSPDVFEKYIAPVDREGAGQNTDRFVLTNDFPKAFRVGECKVLEPGKRTRFQILLFWKDDVKSEQHAINVETEKRDGRWLIGSVTQ